MAQTSKLGCFNKYLSWPYRRDNELFIGASMKLTKNGVPRYRPRPDWEFKTYLLRDVDGKEIEPEVTICVSDWDDFIVDGVYVAGWNVTDLLTDDDWQQVQNKVREHFTEMCESMADYEDERGDWLHDQRKDYLAESRGE